MLNNLTKPVCHLTSKTIQMFSSDTINWRIPLKDPVTGIANDDYLHRYQNWAFQAYLKKRKISRSQIPPKIHIIDNIPQSQKKHLQTQKLFKIKKLLDDSLIQKIIKEDPSQIDTGFILSVFCQQNFKQLIDQYLSKVLVCGKCPDNQNVQKMQQIQNKVINLYKNFYFGQMITPLQRQIQIFYLAAKQNKSMTQVQGVRDKHYLYCRWTQQDQRIIQDIRNWPVSDINLSDLSYRSFYQPLKIQDRRKYVQKFFMLSGGDSFMNKLAFNYTIKKQYIYSEHYLNWIRTKIFSRTLQYNKSLQFTHQMRIPPDFAIQLAVLNIHVWLIINRLQQFDTKRSKNLALFVSSFFKQYVNGLLGSLNLKKLSTVQKTYNEFLEASRKNLSIHFNMNQQTKNNPYKNIDALVWSSVYKQKIHRYSDQVYMFSQYLVKNYQLFKQYDQQDFLDAACQFDCYNLQPGYKQKIISINGQMQQSKFEQQFKKDSQNKDYYYKTVTAGNQKQIDMEQFNKRVKNTSVQYSLIQAIATKFVNFYKRYMSSLDKYDKFSEIDRQNKQQQQRQKKSAWKGGNQRIQQIQKQFSEVNNIRNLRKKNSSNIINNSNNNSKKN